MHAGSIFTTTASTTMYEQVIRQVIERCYMQYGWPPRKIAVTVMFFQQLRTELRQNSMTYDDPNKEVDIVFGDHTRVYAIPAIEWSHKPSVELGHHVISWEVSLGFRP